MSADATCYLVLAIFAVVTIAVGVVADQIGKARYRRATSGLRRARHELERLEAIFWKRFESSPTQELPNAMVQEYNYWVHEYNRCLDVVKKKPMASQPVVISPQEQEDILRLQAMMALGGIMSDPDHNPFH